MNSIIRTIKAFRKDENGATLIEYGLVGTLIAVVCIASLTAVGNKLIAMFTSIAAQIHG